MVLAAFVCTLAIQTATTRMIYSMSRDEVLPFSRQAAQGLPPAAPPCTAAILVGVGAAVLLLVNLGHAGVFTALTSTCIVLLYLAYLCVTAPMLYRRIKGWPTELGPQNRRARQAGVQPRTAGDCRSTSWPWSTGLAMAINLAWPPARRSIDPEGTNPVLQYFAIIVLAVTGIGGAIAFNVKKRDYRRAIGTCPGRWSGPRWRTWRRSPSLSPEWRTRSPASLFETSLALVQ